MDCSVQKNPVVHAMYKGYENDPDKSRARACPRR